MKEAIKSPDILMHLR